MVGENSARSKIVNALTIDVEDYFHVAAFSKVISRSSWDQLEYRAEKNTCSLLNLLDQHGVHATFFVLGWVAKRSPALVRLILKAGHEIASHGMDHALVYRQTQAEFQAETADAKALLEDICGVQVRGYRASTYSITKQSLWALDVLCNLGFEYDSSIFPIRHDKYGIAGASPVPSRLQTPGGHEIVEFPLSTVAILGATIPVAGGGYFRQLPYAVTRYGLNKLNVKLNRPFVFYLHPWEIDIGQPRVSASWFSRYRHYTNIERTEERLKKLLQEFRFGCMGDVLAGLGLIGARVRPIGYKGDRMANLAEVR
jgi:polysaccharide deacetylase family protein (PEP-CTERM system associated)